MGIELDKSFHLESLKITIDYLKSKYKSEKHDELIHDLIKVIKFIKHNHIELKSESNQKYIKGNEI